eukprot:scaffold12586_cov132-Isochrysis_galbana.AAC.12
MATSKHTSSSRWARARQSGKFCRLTMAAETGAPAAGSSSSSASATSSAVRLASSCDAPCSRRIARGVSGQVSKKRCASGTATGPTRRKK